MLLKATNIELYKLFRRGRSFIGIVAVVIIVSLMEIGLKSGGQSLLDTFTNNLSDNFYLQGNLLNGYLAAYLALNTLWIHLPILIVIVTGDLVSGEASAGTFRLLMTRPLSRETIITAKFIAALIYVFILVILLGLISLGLGIILFGKGDLIVLSNGISIIPENDLPFRFLLAFLYGLISMWMVGTLSFFFSCIYENSLTPILASMAIVILFTILSNFEISFFDPVKPYLFTTYLGNWRSFFEFTPHKTQIIKSSIILLSHIMVLFLISVYIFRKKDITT